MGTYTEMLEKQANKNKAPDVKREAIAQLMMEKGASDYHEESKGESTDPLKKMPEAEIKGTTKGTGTAAAGVDGTVAPVIGEKPGEKKKFLAAIGDLAKEKIKQIPGGK